MSMAHSVESRVPLLDLELVRFAARIPDRFRFGGGPKGLLKDALRRCYPTGCCRSEVGLHLRPGRAVRQGPRPHGP